MRGMLSPLIKFHPFHGSSTDVGTFGSLLFPRWPNPSLEVFKPIEHDLDLGCCEFLVTRLPEDSPTTASGRAERLKEALSLLAIPPRPLGEVARSAGEGWQRAACVWAPMAIPHPSPLPGGEGASVRASLRVA